VVLAVEPLSMPSFHRGLEGKGNEILFCAGMYADSNYYLAVGDTRLIFQEKVVFEECKIRGNCEVNLTKIDKNNDLKNGIGI
jgi:hypothetical protein